ncbi:hypothetical protein MGYG_08697 [Nannizzia gypsea CBS 118893]|uniref:Rhodopsin domain-containing protein n=1 Tax=Arthroderma gypseum (strain ATCC MYA-4604 / CBS 118893) TaxID=535722 RepID=E4V6Q7_ARTGP|nr:hypothetical protein MGYG_08697 [Nannizzia gypsea CBS 118893]EFQ96773.1 hypothetical protein MGYG_08697 [Nannizzia gypsea CBS 118893]
MESRDLSDLWKLPAGPPPPGVKSNFVDPPSLAMPIVIVNAISLGLMMVAVIARFIAKSRYSQLRWDLSDDTTVNYGRHMWDIPALSLTMTRTKQYAAVDIIYILTSFFIKISILLLLNQLFHIIRELRRLIYIGIVVISIVTVPYLTVSIIRVSRCNGVKALGIKICSNKVVSTTNLFFGLWNVLSDFYILAIPISQIKGLKMPYKRKIGVMTLFLAGFIACSMSIVRLVIIIAKFNKKDPIYTGASLSPYSAVEMKLAIICSCVIFFPAFFRQRKKQGLATQGSSF